ncbi:hypothetical protein DPMN_018603 [Dreissena polymorpha]|uniref:Uncharacterized protein n=1 Tax=Dreissena polymorpha TaxID=45954 RepID=A0A9D4NHK8_DREPO|nr:hypothetical protein DPMN_018603 [Dreissena polymorpha]
MGAGYRGLGGHGGYNVVRGGYNVGWILWNPLWYSVMINVPMTGCHVFSLIWTIFKLVRDINKTNVLTIFHDDWANIVTSRVLTRKTTPPTGGHVFHRTETTFELPTYHYRGQKFHSSARIDE